MGEPVPGLIEIQRVWRKVERGGRLAMTLRKNLLKLRVDNWRSVCPTWKTSIQAAALSRD